MSGFVPALALGTRRTGVPVSKLCGLDEPPPVFTVKIVDLAARLAVSNTGSTLVMLVNCGSVLTTPTKSPGSASVPIAPATIAINVVIVLATSAHAGTIGSPLESYSAKTVLSINCVNPWDPSIVIVSFLMAWIAMSLTSRYTSTDWSLSPVKRSGCST